MLIVTKNNIGNEQSPPDDYLTNALNPRLLELLKIGGFTDISYTGDIEVKVFTFISNKYKDIQFEYTEYLSRGSQRFDVTIDYENDVDVILFWGHDLKKLIHPNLVINKSAFSNPKFKTLESTLEHLLVDEIRDYKLNNLL